MSAFAPIVSTFLLLLVGFLLRRTRVLRQEDTGVINAVIICATVPALAFTIMVGQHLTWASAGVIAAGNIANCVSLCISWALARLLKLGRPQMGAFMIAATFGNTTFMGIPVVEAAFHGDRQAMLYAIMYGELAMSLPVYTLGLWVASRFGGSHTKIHELLSPKRLPTLPAMIAGVALSALGIAVPLMLMDAIKRLGACTLPLSMISVGLMLSARSFRGNGFLIILVSVLKLFCMPAIVYAILTLFGVGGLARQVVTLQAAMPNSIVSGIMTARGGSDAPFVASATLITTLASLGTLPLILTLLK